MNQKLELLDFITIPAWNDYGMVVRIESAIIGSDDAVAVLLQREPDGKPVRYRLEPDEYKIDM